MYGNPNGNDTTVSKPKEGSNIPDYMLQDTEKKETVTKINTKLFPLRVSEFEDSFSLHHSRWTVDKRKEGTGRVVVCRKMGIPASYTFESSFLGPNNGQRNGFHYNLFDYMRMGVAFGKAIYTSFLEEEISDSQLSESQETLIDAIKRRNSLADRIPSQLNVNLIEEEAVADGYDTGDSSEGYDETDVYERERESDDSDYEIERASMPFLPDPYINQVQRTERKKKKKKNDKVKNTIPKRNKKQKKKATKDGKEDKQSLDEDEMNFNLPDINNS